MPNNPCANPTHHEEHISFRCMNATKHIKRIALAAFSIYLLCLVNYSAGALALRFMFAIKGIELEIPYWLHSQKSDDVSDLTELVGIFVSGLGVCAGLFARGAIIQTTKGICSLRQKAFFK
ncbi:hypothetical protein HNP46_004187 [Pseudomonas nitritireducens]|uniref:Uncharacterized protein n=1 Tax=Pseudomonas nitroreducens TaxID=46680 RepID=A0A7W7KMP2_PSENT|nr:hypothetical protein [Pseudomonas nitritireducens]MBB4865306.1 hypothetical protein [Pseudomonas nitritireducens]